MNIRQASSSRGHSNSRLAPQPSPSNRLKYFVGLMLVVFIAICWITIGTTHASSIGAPVKSGWTNYCLDDYRDKTNPGNQVDIWPCNNSEAQDWALNLTQIKHGASDECLTADSATKIDINDCSSDPNQVWLRDSNGYINPNSGLCLSAPAVGEGQILDLESCNKLSSSPQSWTPSFSYNDYKCSGDQAAQVACNAVKQWINWQAEPNAHEALLNNYTGDAAYEEWCADFVSYVYKQAGYPFTNGNFAGWDENVASQIQNQGFTMHSAVGYIPKPGDVAFFDYPGGHVEIVVSGGQTPTFVYGNSGTIDPTTGNGQMAADTILDEGSTGQVEYYLSPNSNT